MVRVLFDSSVLIPAMVTSHPRHETCCTWLNQAETGAIQGIASTHSLAEVYSVLTRLPLKPRISPKLAQRQINENLQGFELVSLAVEDYQTAIDRMVRCNLPGGGIFDALIAQAALNAVVDTILTLNPGDFTRLGEPIAPLVQVPD